MSEHINYLLHLADTTHILGHRCSEWCGHGPILEQDIAMSNIALDYIGQARLFYQYAAELSSHNNTTEDTLAYLRDVNEYRNFLITELPNGDWANSTLRLFLYSTYQYFLYQQLQTLPDEKLAAIASKAIKETAYHVRWSGDWVIRLGDGTEESKQRMEKAIAYLWPYIGEMFEKSSLLDMPLLHQQWTERVTHIFREATLQIPQDIWMQSGGTKGHHTEHLGYILAEMQFLQRAYPNATW